MSDSFSSSGILSQQSSILNISEGFTAIELLADNPHSYCELYQAQRYGRKFVLKVLKSEYANQTVSQELLKKEFLIMNQLDHPNIVRVYSMEEVAGLGLCIVMEYIDGEPIHTSDLKNILELLSALHYIHARQIIHRDIKPSNILITHNGNNVKLIDFGLSDTDDFVTLKQPAGTRKYVSPEQLSGDAIDNRADIYSFGVVLKELDIRGKYRKIVNKCISENPEKRYQNVEEIEKQLKSNRYLGLMIMLFSLIIVGLLSITLFNKSINEKEFSHSAMINQTDTVKIYSQRVDTVLQLQKDTVLMKYLKDGFEAKLMLEVKKSFLKRWADFLEENPVEYVHNIEQSSKWSFQMARLFGARGECAVSSEMYYSFYNQIPEDSFLKYEFSGWYQSYFVEFWNEIVYPIMLDVQNRADHNKDQ